ncbi:MAG: hypothetical protein MI749_19350, partial [Desulfovibrionales bacterium]|nr:hypothetical protein [Desulfovibrionales bacterium]
IGIVPTLWGRGDPLGCYGEFCVKLGEEKLVIKPRVSASAEDTFVIGCDRDLDRVARLFRNREWMVQAFMGAVIDEGEFSLFYFNGVLSHVVLKQPHPGDFRVQEEYGGQTLWVKDVEPDLVTAGQGVMNGLDASPLYARVDMVRGDGEFLLMELELIEPSLFLSVDPGAPERFARAIDHRLGNL